MSITLTLWSDTTIGSAMDALQKMNSYLATRPQRFASLASGIEWQWVSGRDPTPDVADQGFSTRSRTLRNSTAARASVPSLLRRDTDTSISQDSGPWIWRTDLSATEFYWQNWFTGLSKKFLEAHGGKLLILAGTDRLDKELMIGQMQGRCRPFTAMMSSGTRRAYMPCIIREISVAGFPRRWAFYTGGPAGQNSYGDRRFLPKKRPKCTDFAA